MSDLEDKINSVLNETVSGYHRLSEEEKQPFLNRKVDKIVQAVADEGYVKVCKSTYRDIERKEYIQYTLTHLDGSGELFRVPVFKTPTEVIADFSKGKLSKVMTAQEWYSRFEEELGQYDGFTSIDDVLELVRKAAQRASGVKDD